MTTDKLKDILVVVVVVVIDIDINKGVRVAQER
jgi:hypothetical protein